MAWDFSTDPEFNERLDWMREFVRSELWPLETILDELSHEEFEAILRPLKDEVRGRGLWAAHLPPELGDRASVRSSSP